MPRRARSAPEAPADPPPIRTVADAARRVGLSYGAFRKHVLPHLRASRAGRRWLITDAMLVDFLRGRTGRRILTVLRAPKPKPLEGG